MIIITARIAAVRIINTAEHAACSRPDARHFLCACSLHLHYNPSWQYFAAESSKTPILERLKNIFAYYYCCCYCQCTLSISELTEVHPREDWDSGTSFNGAEFALGYPTHPMQSSLCPGAHSKTLGGSSVACCALILGPTLINIFISKSL